MQDALTADGSVWSARFGPYAFGVAMPAEFGEVRRPWHGPMAASLALCFRGVRTDSVATDVLTHFEQLDAERFSFSATCCAGTGDWTTGLGQLVLHDGRQDRRVRVTMLHEALFAACYAWLLPRGGLLLHAATLWIDGRAYVVPGPSTAGKSTLSARFSPNWWSDEHAFLEREGDTWHVLRHPEFRANPGDFPWRAPLAGLLWLGPDRSVSRLTPMSRGRAAQVILPQALLAGSVTSAFVLDSVAHLCEDVPVAELSHCLATPLCDLATVIAGVGDVRA